MIYISAFRLHISPAVAFPSTSQLQADVECAANFGGNCQRTYLGLKLMKTIFPDLMEQWSAGSQQGVKKDLLWLLIIMKKAFHTVLRVMGPSFNLHILPSHMHTYPGAPLKVTLSLSQKHAVAVFASEYRLLLVNSRVLGGFAHSV